MRVVREPPARTEPSGVLASRFEDDVTEERVETAPSVPATAPVALGSSGRPWHAARAGGRPGRRDGAGCGTGAPGIAPAGVPQTLQ